MILSFIFFLSLFAIIGISSAFKSKGNKQDYYLASHSVSAPLVGLSAVATNNSGYMFIGVIGYTYNAGLVAFLLMFGWIIGDFLSSVFIHKRLRQATEKTEEVSFAGVLTQWHGDGEQKLYLQKMIAAISLLFLLAYASAQLVAGSKALQVLFEWPAWAGAVIGAVLVMAYCMSGGIRASIWTDAAQSVVMIVAMSLLLFIAVSETGGFDTAVSKMNRIDGFMDWIPKNSFFPGATGVLLFIIGWGFAGFSVIGQPHIMVRFMTLDSVEKMNQARLWYYVWFIVFYMMATGVGLLSRIYLPDAGAFDAELALPMMALKLLPSVFVGLVLAGIFAATMSTADSLILSCSSALTHDLLSHKQENIFLIKLGTGVITLFALLWALLNQQSVFSLVIMAWSALASAFAPLLLILCLGGKPSFKLSLIAIFAGLSIAFLWRYLEWHQIVYEGMAGILTGLLLLAPSLFNKAKQEEI